MVVLGEGAVSYERGAPVFDLPNVPLEAWKGGILNVGLLRVCKSRGAFGHAVTNIHIRYRVT